MTYNREWYRNYAKKNRDKINAYQREWGKKNRKKRNQSTNKWKRNNPEKVKITKHKSYLKNRVKVLQTTKKYYIENKERLDKLKKISSKIYRKNNRDKINLKTKEWTERNRDRVKENGKRWVNKNRARVNYFSNIRVKNKRISDVTYRLSQNIGIDIWHALKDKKYSKKWQSLVGYTTNDLIEHLEKQFDKNMNWNNYGKYWSIDHKKPRSLFKFDSHNHPEFKECWALDNLQPMEKIANIKKGKKYTNEKTL